MKDNLVKDFVDETGHGATITLESNDNKTINLGNRTYKLQTPYTQKARKKGIFTSEIGVKSSGFAPIFTLALIVTIGTAIIAFLLWKF